MIISPDHTIIEINRAGCDMLGLPREQIVGKKCFELMHSSSSPISSCPCTTARQSLQPATCEYEQDGRSYELLAWPLPEPADGGTNMVHIVKDVTERRQLEKKLARSQRLEAVGRLAGGIAHDFNNLLTVIINYSGFVLEDLPRDHPSREDLEQVREAGVRASELTRQILAFSRKQVLEPEIVNFNDIVIGIEPMLRRLLGEDIEVVVRLSEDLGNIEADPGQLEQVIMNLAINARDAMPGGGKLIIETANAVLDESYARGHPPLEPGHFVMLAVSDTGQGMDEDVLEHIFEPFFTTKEKDKGTGLGLATVYGIVKQSGGFIWVYSEPGKGTTFKIYMPRTDAGTAARKTTPLKPAAGNETILVVEDEPAVLRLAERILSTAGYQVLTASSGDEALAVAGKHKGRIDLLLTDVVMPGMSGEELWRRLASKHPGLGVLFMSGYTDSAVSRNGLLQEGARILAKPFTPGELTSRVREAIEAAGREAAPPPAAAAAATAPPSEEAEGGAGKERVLVVDDEEAIRRAYRRMLEGAGFEVSVAASGREALQALKGGGFSVVVSDITMANMDGLELLRAVRESDLDLPVILVTGNPSIEDAARAVEYGALRYLMKPVEMKRLVDEVRYAAKLRRIAKLKREAATYLGAGDRLLGDRAGLEASMERGLETLWMAYQPIVSVPRRHIVAFEALVRTREPSMPHPGALFSAAERLGSVHRLGRLIRARVADALADDGFSGDIFINLHPTDLFDEELFSADCPLLPFAHRVVLEITERAALERPKEVPERVRRLRSRGFRVALDDLGAGYAGLSYFSLLEPEVVKLDISLVRNIDSVEIKQRLVGSLASMCRDMGMTVVAEGVETAGERDTLLELGCDLMQGFHFARPAAAFPQVSW